MIQLVLAHENDVVATELVARLGAMRVTPRDLSRRGWRHHATGGGEDAFAIGDRVILASEVGAVITRIAAVQARDLLHLIEEDRAYVAAEMTAFLLSFLLALPCPVLNRPNAGSLMGVSWTPIRWRVAATRAGFHVRGEPGNGRVIMVVGDRVIGDVGATTARAALALAHAAEATLLGIEVREEADGAVFVAAHPWAPLDDEGAAVLAGLLA